MGVRPYRRFCGIYKIESPIGKMYIGSSVDIKARWRNHRNSVHKTFSLIGQSFKTYGVELHTFEMIELCDKSELLIRERYWQEHYNSTSDQGLNMMLVSDGVKPCEYSEDLRNILRVTNKRSHTEESKLKISRGKKGKQCKGCEFGTQLVDIETGVFYDSIRDAGRYSKYTQNQLYWWFNGRSVNRSTLRAI